MTLDEKLDNFYKSAIEDATKKSTEMIEEYKKSLNKIFESHKEEITRKAELDLRIEKEQYIREKNKALSEETLKIRKSVSKKNNALVEILFKDVLVKLQDFMKTEEYTELLVKQIKEALQFAKDNEITIYIDPIDEEKKETLEGLTNSNLTLSSYSFIGGMRAVIPSKNILIDNSFLNKLEEIKEEFTLD